MPAPRAVLIDIMKLGLDPKKPHTSLTKNGRLSQKVKKESILKTVKEVAVKVEVPTKKETKLPLPSLPPEEEKVAVVLQEEVPPQQEEVKVELPSVQEVVEVQTVQQEETKLEEVIEEKQPTFQSLSQQDRFKKKNALKKM